MYNSMKKFILNIFFFAIPILVLFVVIESYVTFSSNTFTVKAKYLKKNLKNVEVLVLGSSHHQTALNPEFFDLKTINLAYGMQDIHLDAELFFKYATQMDSLKTVILEFDYLTIGKKVDQSYFRLSWYYRLYGIELYDIPLKYKLSMYASSSSFFNNYCFNKFNDRRYTYKMNQNGFVENDFPGIFLVNNYDVEKLNQKFIYNINRMTDVHAFENIKFNAEKINSIISYCSNHNIKVVLLSSPLYSGGKSFEVEHKRKLINHYLEGFLSNKNVTYLDFQNDKIFIVNDFKDYDHLNSIGAKKYSLILNDYLNVSESSNH